jgi:hypothetical protein
LQRLAAAWLLHEDWERWKEIDRALEPDRATWLDRIEGAIARIESKGFQVSRVPVCPDHFLTWCRSVGAKPDRHSRTRFAAHLVEAGHHCGDK